MNNKFCCGIDVSKKKLDVVLLKEEKFHYKVFENSNDGGILPTKNPLIMRGFFICIYLIFFQHCCLL